MTDLSRRDRDTLSGEMVFLSGGIIATDRHGGAKLLIQWRDADRTGAPEMAHRPRSRSPFSAPIFRRQTPRVKPSAS